MIQHNCRVCGLYIEEVPWSEDEHNPTYEICSCCGVEFGNEDHSYASVKAYRIQWIASGAGWFTSKEKPKEWNLEQQLNDIPATWK